MPDNVKMSLQNALTIAGLIVACAVSYSAIMTKVRLNAEINEKQNLRLEKLEYGAHQSELDRQRQQINQEAIMAKLEDLSEFIKEIDEIQEK